MITTSGFFSLSCSTWGCTSVALDDVGDVQRDVQALVLEASAMMLDDRVAVLGVLVDQRDGVDLRAGRLLSVRNS